MTEQEIAKRDAMECATAALVSMSRRLTGDSRAADMRAEYERAITVMKLMYIRLYESDTGIERTT